MVTRKPLPEHATLDPAVSAQTRGLWSPASTGAEAFWEDEAVQREEGQQRNSDPDPSDVPNSLKPGATAISGPREENNVWAEDTPPLAGTDVIGRVPSVLRPGSSHKKDVDAGQGVEAEYNVAQIPTVLQPGDGATKAETNPFKRKMSLSASRASSREELNKSTTPPNAPPVPSAPVDAFSQLSVNESSRNPWRPALDEGKEGAVPPPASKLYDQDSERDNVWDSAKPSRQAIPGLLPNSPAMISLPSEEVSTGWEEISQKPDSHPPLITTADEKVLEESHAWDDLGSLGKEKGPVQVPPLSNKGTGAADDWNLIDLEAHPGPPSKQSTWENFDGEDDKMTKTSTTQQPKTGKASPELPPRQSAEVAPPMPPRPVDKAETYQIKNINWHDATAAKNPRTSPILVQNANGPCPLVALVNALTLTTPADKPNTALVETLRSREQVSLGFLLDAVFDELMSERRWQPDVALPDVSELYEFLKGLHTGMNVNPRFVPTEEVVRAFKNTSLTHLPPNERNDMIPGTFEHTKEMALYSTFSIPLIHGWLPSKDDTAYDSFARQAASYEDAQNLLFREEELEEKLSSSYGDGLTEEEQQIYQDILTIKSFLSISATQLTKFGLDVIQKSMKPGSVAILFRNDHFSTLYRHPQTRELLTLVTDAGYAGHAEVVWESLVDVNGECTEFFSGDFRPVGGASNDQSGPSGGRVPDRWTDVAGRGTSNNDGWTTVQNRRGRNQTEGQLDSNQQHEQEDRDLALALQLQEEEDERHRAEQERRRRESLLSEQFIEQQARSGTTPTSNLNTSRSGGRNSTSNLGRGHSGSRSTTSLTSSGSTATGRRTSASGNHAARPSSASSTSVNANRSRPTTQTVRSLIPPRTPATNRPPEDGLDDAPPSYEQAAGQAPYVPPAGHPSHPASSPREEGALSGGARQGGMSPSPRGSGPVGGGFPGAVTAGARPTGMRRGPPPPSRGPSQPVPAAGAGGGKERDCVVM
ncbi:Protein FAM63A [Madurella mycetomatis]|uniref:Protein FAM63A n=1 Tax=Madurella mycetomatis TaxID=100816 RepID=A0A175W0F3_9PEZI|nr:Protein FAM63A [Madurella mycetomatis]